VAKQEAEENTAGTGVEAGGGVSVNLPPPSAAVAAAGNSAALSATVNVRASLSGGGVRGSYSTMRGALGVAAEAAAAVPAMLSELRDLKQTFDAYTRGEHIAAAAAHAPGGSLPPLLPDPSYSPESSMMEHARRGNTTAPEEDGREPVPMPSPVPPPTATPRRGGASGGASGGKTAGRTPPPGGGGSAIKPRALGDSLLGGQQQQQQQQQQRLAPTPTTTPQPPGSPLTPQRALQYQAEQRRAHEAAAAALTPQVREALTALDPVKVGLYIQLTHSLKAPGFNP
jgi:hypothetical protein